MAYKQKGMKFHDHEDKKTVSTQADAPQVGLSKHEKSKGTVVTGGSKSEVINDLEDRIEFLTSDLSDAKDSAKKAKIQAQLNKLKTRLVATRKSN